MTQHQGSCIGAKPERRMHPRLLPKRRTTEAVVPRLLGPAGLGRAESGKKGSCSHLHKLAGACLAGSSAKQGIGTMLVGLLAGQPVSRVTKTMGGTMPVAYSFLPTLCLLVLLLHNTIRSTTRLCPVTLLIVKPKKCCRVGFRSEMRKRWNPSDDLKLGGAAAAMK